MSRTDDNEEIVRTFSRTDRVVKRTFDLVIAVPALLIALPFSLIIAILVAISSRAPVFFTQERVGRGGTRFKVIKFRTMRHGTDREVQACGIQRQQYAENDFKLPSNDPRITKVGRVLRATSLDELPQLLNVMRGDMAIVGIRPLLPQELHLRTDYEQAGYRAMKPGMTGLWQVNGRSTVQDHYRRELDIGYVERWTLMGDARILLRTPMAVLRVGHAA